MTVRSIIPTAQWQEPDPEASGVSAAARPVYLRLDSGVYVFDTTGPNEAVFRDDGSGEMVVDDDVVSAGAARMFLIGATRILILP